MWSLIAKALLAGAMIAAIAEIGRRLPAMAALVVSLPLVSILGMMFLWHVRPDAQNRAVHPESTFWYVLARLPMFLAMPVFLWIGAWNGRRGGKRVSVRVKADGG